MPCGRQWLRTRKGRPAFSSEIICWICGRISGFQGGIFAISWRFWSLTSGIQTPLKSGWAAEAREATDVPSSPVTQQIIANFFATVFTVTNRWVLPERTRPLWRLTLGSSLNNSGCCEILVATIAKEKVANDPMYGPAVRCKRCSSSWHSAVLHQCIRSLIGAVLLRTIMDISARAISLTDRPQRARVTSFRMRREDRTSISSHPLADLGR